MQNNLFIEKIILFKLSCILSLIVVVTFPMMFTQNKQSVKQSIFETSFHYIDLKVN